MNRPYRYRQFSDRYKVEVSVSYEEGSVPPTAVGVYEMAVVIKVTDADGNDVTGHYDITVVSGFLTICRGNFSAVTL